MADTALGLSDEEFLKQDPSTFLADEPSEPVVEEASEPVTEEAPVEPVEAEDSDTKITSEAEASEELQPSEEGEEVSAAQEEPEGSQDEDAVGQPAEDTPKEHEAASEGDSSESLDTSDQQDDTDGDTQETSEVDYESAFKRITQPFKANGVDMQVSNPDDIVKLMQMGANYQKKMAQLKPNLKAIKMLENNGLLDEGKLNNLIDLSKKDPKAIAQLVKDSGIDPLDITSDSETDEYRPTNYSVSDKEYELDQVLDSIKDTDTFSQTINILTKDWDQASRTAISDNPGIISIINAHMSNGVFEKVNAVLTQEKALGNLNGVSDVEAYRQIAEQLAQSGVLKERKEAQQDTKPEVSTDTETKPEQSTKAAEDRKNKRKAVAPVKQTNSTPKKAEENFLGLSDDEFMKKYASG